MTVIALNRMTVLPTWLLVLTAAVFVVVVMFRRWLWETRRRRFWLGVLAIVYFGFAAWASLSPPLVIYYEGKPLKNGQNIKLTTLTDKSRRPLHMFVQPELNLFGVVGISARNRGGESLEADSVYLSFSSPIRLASSGPWQPSPDRNVEGWTTFLSAFGVNSIMSGHPLDIPDFLGTPVLTEASKVKLAVEYGSEEAKVEFTLGP